MYLLGKNGFFTTLIIYFLLLFFLEGGPFTSHPTSHTQHTHKYAYAKQTHTQTFEFRGADAIPTLAKFGRGESLIGLDTYLTGWAKQYKKGARGAGERKQMLYHYDVYLRIYLAQFFKKRSVVARGGFVCITGSDGGVLYTFLVTF